MTLGSGSARWVEFVVVNVVVVVVVNMMLLFVCGTGYLGGVCLW